MEFSLWRIGSADEEDMEFDDYTEYMENLTNDKDTEIDLSYLMGNDFNISISVKTTPEELDYICLLANGNPVYDKEYRGSFDIGVHIINGKIAEFGNGWCEGDSFNSDIKNPEIYWLSGDSTYIRTGYTLNKEQLEKLTAFINKTIEQVKKNDEIIEERAEEQFLLDVKEAVEEDYNIVWDDMNPSNQNSLISQYTDNRLYEGMNKEDSLSCVFENCYDMLKEEEKMQEQAYLYQ